MQKLRFRFKISFLLFVIILSGVKLSAQTITISNIRTICCDSLFLTKPVWNSDGNSILLTGENNSGLYLFDIPGQKLVGIDKSVRIKSKPVWLKSGDILYLKGKGIEFVSSFKSTGQAPSDTVLTIDTRAHKIKAYRLSDGKSWDITPERNLYYNPIISPNAKFAIVHLKSEMYLYATDGTGLIRHLGTGIASNWSPDGKYIFYFRDESSDGHSISNSDIYVISIDTKFNQKLTQSTDRTEMWPAVSLQGNQISFADEKSGKIFVADLKITVE